MWRCGVEVEVAVIDFKGDLSEEDEVGVRL